MEVTFEKGFSQRGYCICYQGFRYVKNKTVVGKNTIYWHCGQNCGVTAVTKIDELTGTVKGAHSHPPDHESQEVSLYSIVSLR
jgi:hypothetical protein